MNGLPLFVSREFSWQSHDKPEIRCGSTPSLQPRFGTFGLLVVPKLEGDVKGSTFFIGCRSRGGCAQMVSSKPETFFINGMEKWIERVKKCMAINGDYVEK